MWYSSEIFIERVDVESFKEGATVTLINWGNVTVTKITRYDHIYHSLMTNVSMLSFLAEMQMGL